MWVALQLSLPKGEVGAYVRANAPAYTCASMCLKPCVVLRSPGVVTRKLRVRLRLYLLAFV